MINSFTFYFDYYNLIDTLPLKDKETLLVAITDYMFKDIEPRLSGHNQAIFNTLRKQLNVSKLNSKRRIKDEDEQNKNKTETKPNENQEKTETEPQEKPNQNKTSILSFKFYISNFKFINNNLDLINKLEEWFIYKKEKRNKYTETGIKTLLKRIDTNVEEYGTEKIIDLIDNSIANNYQGIVWENLKTNNNQKTKRERDAESRESYLNRKNE